MRLRSQRHSPRPGFGRGSTLAALLAIIAIPVHAETKPGAEFAAGVTDSRAMWGELPDYGPQPVVSEPSVAAPASSRVAEARAARSPRLRLTYSRFSTRAIGGEEQPFSVPAVTLFVHAKWLRIGASTRLGLEEGSGGSSSSWFIDEVFGVGVQQPHLWPYVVPFLDARVGFGFRMYTTFNNTLPSLMWSYGVEAGVDVYIYERIYLSLAVGWVRPITSVTAPATAGLKERTLDLYHDTFVFTVGLGL
jgi:hypothetical protein